MSALSPAPAAPAPLQAPAAPSERRRWGWRPPIWALGALGLIALIALAVLKRTGQLGAPLWADEALSIGIASHPLGDIPALLRDDGSPPLYYLLLHGWIALFGRGEVATHWLSALFGILLVPAAWWAGRSLFGSRAGWTAAALAALSPFVSAYAQETRMYALLVLLSVLATAAFVHAFAFARRRYLPLFAVCLAALIYTHNWGLFFFAAAGVALLALVLVAPRVERRRLLLDGALAFGGSLVLFSPWVPTLLAQAGHTGAPWIKAPAADALIWSWGALLGDDRVTVALLLGGGAAIALALRERDRPRGRAFLALLVLAVATLAVAWVASQFTPAWTTRYMGVVLGPLLLLAAAALAAAGRRGAWALALVLVLWLTTPGPPSNKSNADDLATEVRAALAPGDLVVSTQPEQTPLLAYYLPSGLRYATTLGPQPDPRVLDWRDALGRLERASPARALEPALARLRPGQHVLLVRPGTEVIARWTAPWTRLVRRRSAQWGGSLADDRRFRRLALVPRFYRGAAILGLRGVLYVRTPLGIPR